MKDADFYELINTVKALQYGPVDETRRGFDAIMESPNAVKFTGLETETGRNVQKLFEYIRTVSLSKSHSNFLFFSLLDFYQSC
jgi:hypothetical protein